MTDTAAAANPAAPPAHLIPPPPRRLTARGRRRSWNERPVRIWMILVLILLAATSWFAWRDLSEAMKERALIRDGKLVAAKVLSVDGYLRPDRAFARDSMRHVKLSYTLTPQDVKPYEVEQDLPPKAGGVIAAGGTVDLRVDPADPKNVTTQTTPREWLANLAVVTLFVAGLTVVILIMLWQQRRIVKTWRHGELIDAIVVDTQHAGIAPFSRVVRFTPAIADGVGERSTTNADDEEDDDDDDQRLFSTLLPNSAGPLESGDTIELIIPKGTPSRAIVARLYV